MQKRADTPPSGVDGALRGLPQQCFEFCEDLLDRIEVGAVGRKEEEPCTCGTDGFPHGLSFVASEIVDDDDVAGLECRHEKLFDMGRQ